jgi:hypothetical protein
MPSQYIDAHNSKEADAGVSQIPSEVSDSNVGWDGEDDPENPTNWSNAWKKTIIFLVAFATLNE